MAKRTGPKPTFTPELAARVWRLFVKQDFTAKDIEVSEGVKRGSVAYLVRMHDKTLPPEERHYKEKEQ